MKDDRIWVNPSPVVKGNPMEVGYKGILRDKGADKVYLHYGTDGWKNPRTVPLSKRSDGTFAGQIPCDAEKSIEFCFKDSADHWDNNNGLNWYVPVVKR